MHILRLSLLAQTEALQNECVKKMYDNDKLTEKVCDDVTLMTSQLITFFTPRVSHHVSRLFSDNQTAKYFIHNH